jgi:photosystem II stability/assembly factor-like uncharacterized protein
MKVIVIILFFLTISVEAAWASEPFNIFIKPGTILPTSISKGQTATAYYTVQNNIASSREGNYVRYLPPHVTQIMSGGAYPDSCGYYFDLAGKGNPNDSCTLQLTINGAIDAHDTDPNHHLMVCQGGSDCAGTKDELNIIEGKGNFLARVAVGSFRYSIGTGQYGETPVSYISQDGGVNWAAHILEQPDQNSAFFSVSCSGREQQKYCTAVGRVRGDQPVTYTSTDGGVNWIPHFVQIKNGFFSSVVCDGEFGEHCIATGVTDFGANTRLRAPTMFTSFDSGLSWIPYVLPERGNSNAGMMGISCSNGYCVAVGFIYNNVGAGKPTSTTPLIYTSTDNGTNWISRSIPAVVSGNGGISLRSVSCNGDHSQYCTALGNFTSWGKSITYITKDSGVNWTPHVLLYDQDHMSAITCSGNTGQNCIAVGEYASAIYTSTDSGVNWTPHAIQQNSILSGVICSGDASQYCTAVGEFVDSDGKSMPIAYTSTDGGESWVLHRVIAQNDVNMDMRSISLGGSGL